MSSNNSGIRGLPNPSIKGSVPNPDDPPGPAGPTTMSYPEYQEEQQQLLVEIMMMQQQLDDLGSKARLLVDARRAIEEQMAKYYPESFSQLIQTHQSQAELAASNRTSRHAAVDMPLGDDTAPAGSTAPAAHQAFLKPPDPSIHLPGETTAREGSCSMRRFPCAEPQHSMHAGEVQESQVLHAAGPSTQQAVPPQHGPAGLPSVSLPGVLADGVSGSSAHTPAPSLDASQQCHAERTCCTSGEHHRLLPLLEAYRAATTAPTGTAGNPAAAAAAAAANPSPVACPEADGSTPAACGPVPAAGRPSSTGAQQPMPSADPMVAHTPASSRPTGGTSTSSSSLSRLGGSKFGSFLQQEQSLTLSQGPSRPGREKCEPFLDWGYCRYGSSCIYDHPRTCGVFLTPRGLPFRPAEPICPEYLATNTCKFGPACRNHHPSRGPQKLVLAAKGTASGAGVPNKTLKASGHLPSADAAASAVATLQAKSQATGKDSRPAAAGHSLPSPAGQFAAAAAPAAAAAGSLRKRLKAARSHSEVKPSLCSTTGQENAQVSVEDAAVPFAVSGNSGNSKAPQLQPLQPHLTAPGTQLSIGKVPQAEDGCKPSSSGGTVCGGTHSSSTDLSAQHHEPGDQSARAPPAQPVGAGATASGCQHVLTFSSQATAGTVASYDQQQQQQQQHGHRTMQPPGARLFQQATAAALPDAAAKAAARVPLGNIQPSAAKPPKPRPARAAVKPASKQTAAPKPSAAAVDTKHTLDADHKATMVAADHKATVVAAAQGRDRTSSSRPHTRSEAHCDAAQQAEGSGGHKQRAVTAAGVVPAAAAVTALEATGGPFAAASADAAACPSKQQPDAIDWHLLGAGRQAGKVEFGAAAAAAGAVSGLGSSSLIDIFLPTTSRPIRPLRTCLYMFTTNMPGSMTAEAAAAAAAALPHGPNHAQKKASDSGTIAPTWSEQLQCLDGCTGSTLNTEPKPTQHSSCKPDTFSAAAAAATATAAASGNQAAQQAAGVGCMQPPAMWTASAAPNAAFTMGSGPNQAATSAGLNLHQDQVRASSSAAGKFSSTGLSELAEAEAQEQAAARVLGAALTAVVHAEVEGGPDKAKGWRDLAAALAALKQAAAKSVRLLAKYSSCSAPQAARPNAAQPYRFVPDLAAAQPVSKQGVGPDSAGAFAYLELRATAAAGRGCSSNSHPDHAPSAIAPLAGGGSSSSSSSSSSSQQNAAAGVVAAAASKATGGGPIVTPAGSPAFAAACLGKFDAAAWLLLQAQARGITPIGKAESRDTAGAAAAGAVAGLGPTSLIDSLLATPSRPSKPLRTCRDMFLRTPSTAAQATAAAVTAAVAAAAAAAAQPLPHGFNHVHKMVPEAGAAGNTPASEEQRGPDGCTGHDLYTGSGFTRDSSRRKPDTSSSTAATATASAKDALAAQQAASSAPDGNGHADEGCLQQHGTWMPPAAPGSGTEGVFNVGSGANLQAPQSPGLNVRQNIKRCRRAADKAVNTGLAAVTEAEANATRVMATALSAATQAEASGQAGTAEQYKGVVAQAAALKQEAAAAVQAAHAAKLATKQHGLDLTQVQHAAVGAKEAAAKVSAAADNLAAGLETAGAVPVPHWESPCLSQGNIASGHQQL